MASRIAANRRNTTRARGATGNNDENALPSQQALRQKASISTLGPAGKNVLAAQPVKKGVIANGKAAGAKRPLGGALSNGVKDDEVKDEKTALKSKTEVRQPLGARANNNSATGRPIAPVPARHKQPTSSLALRSDDDLSEMDIDVKRDSEFNLKLDDDEPIEDMSDEEEDEEDEDDWVRQTDEEATRAQEELVAVRGRFKDDIDMFDTTMVAEYADEIFAHMEDLEGQVMPNPRYMDFQTEIEWTMRTTLIDWLLQVHLRYHMLPETLWIAVNLVDRFLSVRVVSLVKLQLVGVTAMFIAAKYEEILAPSVDEFVYMTENGYTKDEILKGERIILQTLDFTISSYCSPYSWCRRISKADDYDIQTRTLSKFLMEVTLLDHRFLRCKPSMVAAVGMYLARKMLGGTWDDAFVFYSNFTESQLIPGAMLLCERLVEPDFESVYVYKKYSNKKFLRASQFARDWAQNNAASAW